MPYPSPHVEVVPADAGTLPRRPGVAIFRGGHGDAVLVGASADLRGFCERRLAAEGPRADLRSVTARIGCVVCGSLFEAECVYLETARALTPATYRASAERWRAWFLHLDPGSDLPVWRKTDGRDLAGTTAKPEHVIGPIRDKDAAARYGRALDDLFELCREPKLLAQRPDATACAYKEMGKCPAPCDGSEPIGAYRARVREALEFARADVREAVARVDEDVRREAASMAFERAAALRVRGETLSGLDKPAFRGATTLDRFAVLAVQPAGRTGWCRLLVFRRGEIVWLADVLRDIEPGIVHGMVGHALHAEAAGVLTDEGLERLSLVSAWLRRPRKGAGTLLAIDTARFAGLPADGTLVREIRAALRRAAKAGEVAHAAAEDARVELSAEA